MSRPFASDCGGIAAPLFALMEGTLVLIALLTLEAVRISTLQSRLNRAVSLAMQTVAPQLVGTAPEQDAHLAQSVVARVIAANFGQDAEVVVFSVDPTRLRAVASLSVPSTLGRFAGHGTVHLSAEATLRFNCSPQRSERPAATRPNEQWSMDLVSDVRFDGRRIRALTLVDNHTREALAIVVDSGIRGVQRLIRVDNGPEFVSKALDRWAYERGVMLDFSRLGKPTANCFVESFNGRLRDECLDTHWLVSLDDARTRTEAWRQDYNAFRPHSALGHLTSQEFAAKAAREVC